MPGLLEPYIPDVSKWIRSASEGYELGDTQRKRDVLLQAGKEAAAGNMPAARRALYAGGNFEQARAIDTHSRALASSMRAASNEQLARALKVQGALADVAHSINTPEEFEATKATLGKAGLDVSKYSFADLPTLKAQALDIKTRLELAIKERAAAGKGQQAPSGYRFTEGGGELEAIPGGPATKLPGETAGRLALMKTAQNDMAQAKQFFQTMGQGVWGRTSKVLNMGEAGQAERTVRSAIEAALRALTGAAAPESEVDRYVSIFGPTIYDNKKTRADKLRRLEEFMRNAEENIMRGHGEGRPATAPQTPQLQQPTRLRFNPETGKLEQVR
jgi:hypothetical protein